MISKSSMNHTQILNNSQTLLNGYRFMHMYVFFGRSWHRETLASSVFTTFLSSPPKKERKKAFATMNDSEKTMFDYWQESLDEMWKRALDEDSDEEEFGTFGCREFSCGGFRKRESELDHYLNEALGYVANGSVLNGLGVLFDDILLGLTPKEKKKRNRSRTDPENHSLSKKSAATTSTHHKKHSSHKKHCSDGISFARSSSFQRNDSLRSNSGSFRSSEDLTRSFSFRRNGSLRSNSGSCRTSEDRLHDALQSRLGWVTRAQPVSGSSVEL
jgi:hypothetical protein